MVQSIDRMLGRLRAEAGPEHLLLPHLRQRLPPRTAPAQRRQGHAVRLRHPRPARRHRAGCAARARAGSSSATSTWPPPSSRWPGCARRPTGRGSPSRDSLRAPRARGGRFVFYDHTYAKSRAGEVDSDRAVGGDIQSIPSYIAVRGKRGLLVRFDLDNSWRGHRLRVGALSLRRAVGGPQRVRPGPRQAVGARADAPAADVGRLRAGAVPGSVAAEPCVGGSGGPV